MVAWPPELEWLAGERVFSVDDALFTWGDVLLAAELRGTLTELTALARRELACSRALAEAGTPPRSEDVRVAARRFRYERDLLSSEELDGWLGRWHLGLPEWTQYLRRTIATAMLDGEIVDGGQLEEDALSAAVAADAICSGALEREASQLAADAALCATIAVGTGPERRELIAQVTAGAAAARHAIAAAADVEREIEARALEWTRLDAELVELTGAEVAREAALCVRIDGRPLIDVAAELGVPCERRAIYLEEAERDGLTELVGAGADELVGPVERDGVFLLVHVRSRTPPSTADRQLRQRAVSYLVEHATARALESRVSWE